MTERPDFSNLNDLLLSNGAYDIALYLAQVGMNEPGGYWTPAYEAKVRAEVAHMEAHNNALNVPAQGDALRRFTDGAVLAMFAVWFAAFWIVGLIALALR